MDPEARERPYWNMEIEPILGTPSIQAIQLRRLRKQIAELRNDSPVIRRRLDQLGVSPDEIHSLAEFQARVPTVTKDDIRAMMMEEFRGDLMESLSHWAGVPREKILLICSTSGTTGEPVPYLFTAEDLECTYESFARCFWRVGLRPGGVVLHAMALSMYLAGIPLVQALQHFGACVIPVGAEGGSDRLVAIARALQPKTLFCTPSYAEYLLEKLGGDARDLGLERLVCGGEPGAGLLETRKRLETGYGARVFDFMGAGSVMLCSCDSKEYEGLHFVTEDTAILEVVDPETRSALPLEQGVVGEWVVTPLVGRLNVVLRHAVGDMFQVFTDPCPCGRTGLRVKILGRRDDMLKVKGVLVYPAAISEVIHSFVPEVSGAFRIVLDAPPPRVVPPLKLKVEQGQAVRADDLPLLAKRIQTKMHESLRISPVIEWLACGVLERATHKAALLERRYEQSETSRD